MTGYDVGVLFMLALLLLICAVRLANRERPASVLHAVIPAVVGCVIAGCAGRSGHPVLAGVMGVATLINSLYVVWPGKARIEAVLGRQER